LTGNHYRLTDQCNNSLRLITDNTAIIDATKRDVNELARIGREQQTKITRFEDEIKAVTINFKNRIEEVDKKTSALSDQTSRSFGETESKVKTLMLKT
jgi:hypothetical protein